VVVAGNGWMRVGRGVGNSGLEVTERRRMEIELFQQTRP
jgi:hypothetical protein